MRCYVPFILSYYQLLLLLDFLSVVKGFYEGITLHEKHFVQHVIAHYRYCFYIAGNVETLLIEKAVTITPLLRLILFTTSYQWQLGSY